MQPTTPNPFGPVAATLEHYRWNIVAALISSARSRQETALHEEWRSGPLHPTKPPFANSPRAFFTETLAAVGP